MIWPKGRTLCSELLFNLSMVLSQVSCLENGMNGKMKNAVRLRCFIKRSANLELIPSVLSVMRLWLLLKVSLSLNLF